MYQNYQNMARSSWCVNPWMSICHLSVSGNIRHFRLSFPGVDRGRCWKPSSRQSSELGALSATHGQRHPSALDQNVKFPKSANPKSFRTQKSTMFFFLVRFFLNIFFMASDIRHKHQMYSWHRTLHAPRRALRSCPAPLCWLWPWKSRPNSWARRSSNYRSFKSLLPKIFRWSI